MDPIHTLLREQHRYYTAELARTHQELSKLYRKLARTERSLDQRVDRDLSRREKKHHQWARSLGKSNIQSLETQQASLHDYLRQCNNLLASFEPQATPSCPSTPWSGHLPPSPYPFTPLTPPTPWAQACFGDQPFQHQWPRPQYWDLSMLRERRGSAHAPSFSASTADSGFCEPAMYAQPFHWPAADEPGEHHVFAHEVADDLSAAERAVARAGELDGPVFRRARSAATLDLERDPVPELPGFSPRAVDEPAVTSGCEEVSVVKQKRRYSEAAISLIESRLAAPKAVLQHGHHRRGLSLGTGAAAFKRSAGGGGVGSIGSAALT